MLHCYLCVSWNPGEVKELPAVTKCKSCGNPFPVHIHPKLVPWGVRTPFPHKRKLKGPWWALCEKLATAAVQLLVLERCLLASHIRSTWKYFHGGQSCSQVQENISSEEVCPALLCFCQNSAIQSSHVLQTSCSNFVNQSGIYFYQTPSPTLFLVFTH